jgi:SAM-dependent methyltransferase
LNGVLEWVGYLTDEVKPNIAQERVLKEILRVLKPEGVLYIGTKNRFAFFNFLGVKDLHTRLHFINLMPRFLANIYCLIVKKHKYKTYLYSYLGYRNLLKKCGFKKIKFYTPLPSYRNFRFIFPLDNTYTIKYWLEYLVLPRLFLNSIYIKVFFIGVKAVLKSPLKYIFKYITLDYSIIAAKRDYLRNEYEDIIISLEHDNRNTKVNTVSLFYYQKSLEKKLLFCFLDNNKWPSYIWRITNEPEGMLRLQNRYNVTKELSLLGPEIAKAVPICKYNRFINNEAAVLNSFRKSTMPLLIKYLSKHRRSLHKMDDIFSLITGWLIVLHKQSCAIEKIGNSSIFKNIISNSLEFYAKRIFLNKQDYGYLSNTLEKEMVKIGNLFLPFVIQHGDFQPENILYDERNRDILIFDWECALIKGLPLVDLLVFLITSAAFAMEGKNIFTKRSEHIIPLLPSLIYNINLQIFKYAFYEKNKISDLLKKYIDIYCKNLNIDKRLKRILFLIFILQYLWHDKIFMQTFLDNENNIFKEDF